MNTMNTQRKIEVSPNQVKTSSDLKYWHEYFNPNSYFFTRKTMKFFGDTMKNYGVRYLKHKHAYELYRRHAVAHGLYNSTYFSADDFHRIFDLSTCIENKNV